MQLHFSRARIAVTLVALAVGIVAPRPAQAQAGGYSVVEVGRLPGMDTSYPNAINADEPGNVKIVGTSAKAGIKYHCFYWSQVTGLKDIGVLGQGSFSQALGVNRSGEVAGQSTTTASGANNHALYWNPSRAAQGPLDLAPTWPVSSASCINDAGVIAGSVYTPAQGNRKVYWIPSSRGVYGDPIFLPGLPDAVGAGSFPGGNRSITPTSDLVGSLPDAAGVAHAVLWKNNSPLTPASPSYGAPLMIPLPLGAPAGSETYASQVAVASDGSNRLLVAGSWDNGQGPRCWVWAEGDPAASDIGTLTSPYSTQIWGLNDRGQVAGHSSITAGSGTQLRAIAWDPVSGLRNLGTLGGTQSRAYGTHFNGMGYCINHAGQVVGFATTSGDKSSHAFLWSASQGLRDLNDTALTPSKGAFSYLEDAACITDNGFITGIGRYTVKGTAYSTTYLLLPK